jgi:hypothetical protein
MSRSIGRLSPPDRLMLGAAKRWPQDIGALGRKPITRDGG